jgi:hypothetical protein
MEHAESPLTLERLTAFMAVVESCSGRKKEGEEVAQECAQGLEPDINCLEKMKNFKAGMHESGGDTRPAQRKGYTHKR